jgi:hypothetical protein
MEEEIMVTVIATGFNSKPKYNGGISPRSTMLPARDNSENGKPKPRVERILQPMEDVSMTDTMHPPRENSTTEIGEEAMPLPKIERMYVPRGTLTEKDGRETFERASIRSTSTGGPISPAERDGVREHAGQISRLTPRTDSRHVPSGPRDLKDYDQPAYLRRGISLPPIEDDRSSVEGSEEPELVGATAASTPERNATPAKDRDDRPAFLKRIMD